ncbi:hypothetical protein [Streptomyces prunicolor]|uniref:hypothetical protein n=1 Tax=Streptomyces prunicolor TaxID=67348 RepID=UPI001FE1B8AF|nr:hypothetical protein [Streptomyces prunicolor]
MKAPVKAPMEACGCGEDQIPWMLAKFGLFGTAGLVLAVLVIMILAGWMLGTVVWLIRRRAEGTRAPDTPGTTASSRDDSGPGELGGFTWRDEDP